MHFVFMGPLEKDKPWSTVAIEGTSRFLNRAYRIIFNEDRQGGNDVVRVTDKAMSSDDEKMLHITIKKVTEDIEGLRFNTAISQMMVFVNHFTNQEQTSRVAMKAFTQLLAPFAPHLAEEFWEAIGEKESLSYAAWPTFDPKLVVANTLTIAIQVLGKLRGTVEVAPGTDQATLEAAARAIDGVNRFLEGKEIVKVVYVKDKILNYVVK
jgi:leucyl-tRNA synthetase